MGCHHKKRKKDTHNIGTDKTLRLWDTNTGMLKRTLTMPTAVRKDANGPEEIEKVTFSPDGRIFVSWTHGRGSLTRLWNETTNTPKSLSKDAGFATNLAFSADGGTLATGEWCGTLHFWDTSTGKHKKTLLNYDFTPYPVMIERASNAKSIVLSPNADKLAISHWSGIIYLWDTVTRQQQSLMENAHDPEESWLSKVLFSPDGKTLASSDSGKTHRIRLWDVDTGKHKRTLKRKTAINYIAFSPDSKTLASGGVDKNIHLWDVDTGKQRRTLKGHTDAVTRVLFSPDGQLLVSGSMDNTIRLWNLQTGTHKQTFVGHTAAVSNMVFSPDAQTLASGSVKGNIHLWDIDAAKQKQTLIGHADAVSSIVFSPDGFHLASTGVDGTVRLWDTNTGEQKQTLTGYKGTTWNVFFYTEGLALASRNEGHNTRSLQDQNIDLWDLVTGQRKEILKGHTRDVFSISFSADGRTLVSGSDDKTVLLWDLTSIIHNPTKIGLTQN